MAKMTKNQRYVEIRDCATRGLSVNEFAAAMLAKRWETPDECEDTTKYFIGVYNGFRAELKKLLKKATKDGNRKNIDRFTVGLAMTELASSKKNKMADLFASLDADVDMLSEPEPEPEYIPEIPALVPATETPATVSA